MQSRVASKSTVVLVALAGAAAAFALGAHAGAALNGRVMAVSVARMPLPNLGAR